MKAMKYLLVGALMGISVSTMAQEVEFSKALAPIAQELKANPANGEKMAKSFIKEYKKDPEAILALGSTYLTVKNYDKANEMADMVLERNRRT